MSDPLTPVLPPIPNISLDEPSALTPPMTPTAQAVTSLASSIDNDMPISEVVSALKSAQPPAVALTEVNAPINITPTTPPQTPTDINLALITPPASNPHLVSTIPTSPVSAAIPVTPTTMAPPVHAPVTSTIELAAPATPNPSTAPAASAEKSPLFEDPDLIKVPGSA